MSDDSELLRQLRAASRDAARLSSQAAATWQAAVSAARAFEDAYYIAAERADRAAVKVWRAEQAEQG